MASMTPMQQNALRFLRWFGPLSIVVSILVMALGYHERGTARMLAMVGANVPGLVVAHRETYAAGGSKNHYVNVQFKPEGPGGTRIKSFHVTATSAGSIQDGSTVQVRYLRSDPSAASIVGARDASPDNFIWGGFGFLAGCLATAFAYLFKRGHRNRATRRAYSR